MAQSMARSLEDSTAHRSRSAAVVAILLMMLFVLGSTTGARGAVVTAAHDPGPMAIAAAADTTAPTTPTDFRVVSRTKGNQITLGATESTDDVGVAGYSLYRDGRWKGTLYAAGVALIGLVFYDRLDGRIKSPVTYELYAFDAAGNVSNPASLVVAP